MSDFVKLPDTGGFPQISVNSGNGFPEPWEAVAPGALKNAAMAFPPGGLEANAEVWPS